MTDEQFADVVQKRLNHCANILLNRAQIYSSESDRLANFKRAGALQHCLSIQALGGMLAKHIIALFDFIEDPTIPDTIQWEEKITDTINYCLLLNALLLDEKLIRNGGEPNE